jgi:hypothetical protein
MCTVHQAGPRPGYDVSDGHIVRDQALATATDPDTLFHQEGEAHPENDIPVLPIYAVHDSGGIRNGVRDAHAANGSIQWLPSLWGLYGTGWNGNAMR